ncbi:MAG TPA: AbrB/MazE/SpoVT family DNA-binding domain-containing protein [Vicinamibacteria bacterium]
MPSATVTSKGQLTLPKEIRERLGVHKGDRVEFRTDRTGRVWVEPATQDLRALRGLFGPVGRVRTQDELDAAVRRGAAGEEP